MRALFKQLSRIQFQFNYTILFDSRIQFQFNYAHIQTTSRGINEFVKRLLMLIDGELSSQVVNGGASDFGHVDGVGSHRNNCLHFVCSRLRVIF